MADYTIIADIGNALAGILRSEMIPEVLLNEESIGVCSPEDKGDFQLGLYLYDVKPSELMRNSEMHMSDINTQKYPSTYLDLYYMLTAYSNGDVKFRSLEEHKILGRAIQVLSDNSILDSKSLKPIFKLTEDAVGIEHLSLTLEEKMKIWVFPNKPYRLSCCFKVAPVELESRRKRETKRVLDIDFSVQEDSRNE